MTIRSYAIAITVLAIFSVGLFAAGGWVIGASGEHFAGQDGDE